MPAGRVPGPRGRWLVGDMENYLADRIGWLQTSRDRYGDLARIAPGTVVTHDPQTAHQVLAETNETYLLETGQLAGRRSRAQAAGRLDRWMAVRRNIWHSFADQLAVSHLSRLTDDAVALLDEHAGSSTDLVDRCRQVSGRLIVDFCLGGDPDQSGLLSAAAARANALFMTALSVLQRGEPRLRWLPRPGAAAAATADQELRDLLSGCVAERRATGFTGAPRDLLDALLAGPKTGDGDDAMIVSVLRMAMFASHGVPGAALSWIALRLAADSGLVAQLRDEAGQLRPDAPTPPALELTGAVIKEVLRLHPPQWLLTRTVLRSSTLAGYPVRPGHQVLVCPYVMHRDPRFWSDPERFDPTRWLGPQSPHSRYAYLPFGAGPRICPGSALAVRQLSVLTAVLARDYVCPLPDIGEIGMTCDGLLLPDQVRGGWCRRVPAR